MHAANVTIRRSKVTCLDFIVIAAFAGENPGGLLIEDVELDCANTNGTGVSEVGFIARRLNIHGCENGLSLQEDTTVEDSYVHDLYEGATGHADDIQTSDPAAGILIRHNTLFALPVATSAVNWTGQTVSMSVENNFVGGGAYTVYCPEVTVPAGAFQVVDNRFADGTEAFGLTDSCDGGDVTFTGNFRDSDGGPVTP